MRYFADTTKYYEGARLKCGIEVKSKSVDQTREKNHEIILKLSRNGL